MLRFNSNINFSFLFGSIKLIRPALELGKNKGGLQECLINQPEKNVKVKKIQSCRPKF